MFTVSEKWKKTYPEASIGLLALDGVNNPKEHPALDRRKAELEESLRQRFAGFDRATLKQLPTIQAYNDYYKRFKKSYHVQLQLESVVFKGKGIPSVAGLVEVMFMAELKNLLLTAGHDLAKLEMPVSIQVAEGSEQYVRMDGQKQRLKKQDMYIADAAGIISSVIYGPDQRTKITADTQKALYTVYAPPGIDQASVKQHLKEIEEYVLLIAPEAQTQVFQIFTTD